MVKQYKAERPFLVVRRNPDRLEVRQATEQGFAVVYPGGCFDGNYVGSTLRRGRVQRGGQVCGTITSAANTLLLFEGINFRNVRKE